MFILNITACDPHYYPEIYNANVLNRILCYKEPKNYVFKKYVYLSVYNNLNVSLVLVALRYDVCLQQFDCWGRGFESR